MKRDKFSCWQAAKRLNGSPVSKTTQMLSQAFFSNDDWFTIGNCWDLGAAERLGFLYLLIWLLKVNDSLMRWKFTNSPGSFHSHNSPCPVFIIIYKNFTHLWISWWSLLNVMQCVGCSSVVQWFVKVRSCAVMCSAHVEHQHLHTMHFPFQRSAVEWSAQPLL